MRHLHIVAGLLALLSGAVALHALKGGVLHRKSGIVFVYSMLAMSASGALMATLSPKLIPVNVIAGVLTFYMVLTALRTVRRSAPQFQWIDGVATLMALAVGLAAVRLGFQAMGGAAGKGDSPVMYFVFGAVALLAMWGDIRLMLGRRLQGTRRIARHLWRMCYGLFVATGSFFLGQAQVFPKSVRASGLLPIPVLLVLAILFYWLVRVFLTRWQPRALALEGRKA